jgi:hypothetical protein
MIDSNGLHIPGEYNFTKLQHLVRSMGKNKVDVYFLQETRWEGNEFDKIISKYHVFRHNAGLGDHSYKRVAITLLPRYYEGWIVAGRLEPKLGKTVGRIISLTIKLDCHNAAEKCVKGENGFKSLSLLLVSAYHPHKAEDYAAFVNELDGHLVNLTMNNSNKIHHGY